MKHIPVKKKSKRNFDENFFQEYYLGGNDFTTLKKFRSKIISENNGTYCFVL